LYQSLYSAPGKTIFTGRTLFVGWVFNIGASATFAFFGVFGASSSESEAFLLLELARLGGIIGVHFTRL
jgi:hypothetical protein